MSVSQYSSLCVQDEHAYEQKETFTVSPSGLCPVIENSCCFPRALLMLLKDSESIDLGLKSTTAKHQRATIIIISKTLNLLSVFVSTG